MKFADTSFLVALLNSKDQYHASAKQASDLLNESVVTTMWVLVELGNAMSSVINRRLFVEIVERLLSHPQWEIVPATPDWFERGLAFFKIRPDKEWSLTDCISFVVMKERGISEALTSDHHFEQAGFTVLLRN